MPTALRGAGWRSDRPREKSRGMDQTEAGLRQKRSAIDVIAGVTPRPDQNEMGNNGANNQDKEEGVLSDAPEMANSDGKRKEDLGDQSNMNANATGGADDLPRNASHSGQAGKSGERRRKETKAESSRPDPSGGKGVGYCRKVLGMKDGKSLPRVPNYGIYSNLLPESYKMPWRQDMKNRAAILANVKDAGKEKLPNIEHNDFLFLRQREQLAPNVEKKEQVGKKVTMPSIAEILKPAFHHHTIKTKDSQRKAIFPAAPSMHFHHPRLRHVTECYACVPDFDE